MAPETRRSQEFVVDIANEPGTLGQLAQVLGKEDINIVGFCAVAKGDEGSVHLITDDAGQAETVLQASGYTFGAREALIVTLEDHPGELALMANKMGARGVNIDAAFITGSWDGAEKACAFSVDDIDAAEEVMSTI